MRTPLVAAFCLVTAACAGSPTREGRAEAPPRAAPVAAGPVALQELPTQTLRSGDCVLALWSRGPVPQRIFAAFAAPPVARVRIGGQTRDLARTGFDGPELFGHPQHQTFAGGDLTVQVDLEFGDERALAGGVVVPTGTLTVRQAGGWEAVAPVGGMIACET